MPQDKILQIIQKGKALQTFVLPSGFIRHCLPGKCRCRFLSFPVFGFVQMLWDVFFIFAFLVGTRVSQYEQIFSGAWGFLQTCLVFLWVCIREAGTHKHTMFIVLVQKTLWIFCVSTVLVMSPCIISFEVHAEPFFLICCMTRVKTSSHLLPIWGWQPNFSITSVISVCARWQNLWTCDFTSWLFGTIKNSHGERNYCTLKATYKIRANG